MTFEREKRLLLGWLALFAPIPLPFNEVLEWPLLFLYAMAVIYFLKRADAGQSVVLPIWSLNLLGLLYLPLFFFDIRLTFIRASPVKALLHLILFLLLVKLYSLRREGETWHLMVAIFFVFLGAMATSSHVTIGLYLFAFLIASLLALARLAQLHVLSRFPGPLGNSPSRAPTLPFRGLLAAGTTLVVLVTIPLFATMPRFREPFVGSRSGLPGISRTTGFSDSVDLSLTTSVRGNRNVVARIQYDEEVANPDDLRFKGATFDLYRNRRWFRLTHQNLRLEPADNQVFHLLNQADRNTLVGPVHFADMYLEPLGNNSLILPSEAIGVEINLFPMVELDLGGAISLPVQSRRDTLRYKVHLTSQPIIAARLLPNPKSELAALDTSDLDPKIAELAAQVMGEGTPEERLDRLEEHLLTQYTYTTDLLGRDGEHPLKEFLFTYKSGQCELFATSMVLMLRSQGIPARFVTGLLSAEFNPLEDYYILRQQNAHAWVEAYTPTRGWKVYDPTPPEGRPAIPARGLRLILTQLADFITFRWDRYVLTYGADDQKSFFKTVREILTLRWAEVKDFFDHEEDGAANDPATEDPSSNNRLWRPTTSQQLTLFACLTGFLAWLVWRHHHPWSGRAAYLRLRTALGGAGLEVLDSTPPRQLEEQAARLLPGAAEPLHRLVELYLLESFADRDLGKEEHQELQQAWRAIHTALRNARKNPPGKAGELMTSAK